MKISRHPIIFGFEGKSLGSALPAFFKIDHVGNAGDIRSVGNACLLFRFLEPRRREVAPAELRSETVPDNQVALIQAAAFLKTPLQNLFIGAALEDALAEIGVIHSQKIAASAVGSLDLAKIAMVILMQVATRVQPDLVQHPGKIFHSADRFTRAFGKGFHTER
jgi:hypothetical protein